MAKAEYRSAVRSRRLICQALAALMREKPLDKITVTDVVNRADLNRGTFYSHYTDIQDVLNRQMEEACDLLRQMLDGRCTDGHTPPDPAELLRQIQRFVQENRDFFASLLCSDLSGIFVDQLRGVFIDYMTAHESEFSTLDHEQYAFMIRFTSGGIASLYVDWFSGKLPMTLDQLTENAILTAGKLGTP
ncbi:MAG: TetR/AcrR family transcriptional regulator [Eubacteriales bacterium]|nr:TetR/AcrR family transcriptional regulator [Eubacteriales bacterium]